MSIVKEQKADKIFFKGPWALYQENIKKGLWKAGDKDQENLVHILEGYGRQLVRKPTFWHRLLRFFASEKETLAKGLYIHGPVGRGKTALMDIFFRALPFQEKKRIHFHLFMQDMHTKLFTLRKKLLSHQKLIARATENLIGEARVLCFDEFHVDNIVDASLLAQVLDFLFQKGVFVVFTSNCAPDDLYAGGLQRERFLPCIALIKKDMHIVEVQGPKDYREKLHQEKDYYFTGPHAKVHLDGLFQTLTGVQHGEKKAFFIKGHTLVLQNVARGVVRASFDELCGQAVGAVDYLALMPTCHAFIIDDVPLLTEKARDKLLRFVILIDIIYESGKFLAISAAAEPFSLCQSQKDVAVFERTASRLNELRRGKHHL